MNPVRFIIGMVRAILTDVIVMSLFIGCVLLGFLTHSALLGGTVYFISYSVETVVLQVANATGIGLKSVAKALHALLHTRT